MTADVLARPSIRRSVLTAVPVVPITMATLFLLRMLLVARPASPDEAGFLTVASQWHVGGTSLYGNYWVDRPPLLIGIFRLADLTGGLTALRVIGALGAVATALLLASTARRAFGPRAAAPTAVVAAALLMSPLYGSPPVNGELLAVPFLALGFRLVVEAFEADDPLVARASALGAGLAAVFALLVKQNMADVVVFALVCWFVAWRTRRISGRTLRDLLALAAVGGTVGGAVVLLWAMAHGTSPLGVFDATYPFRIKAGVVLAALPHQTASLRLSRLGLSALLSVAPLAVLVMLARARRLRHQPVFWGLLVAGAYVVVSILSGGSYWLHYLVESVPVVSIAAGAVAVSAVKVSRVLVPAVVIAAVVALVATVVNPAPAPGYTIGTALAEVAQPGDTMLSAFGDADILQRTGMSSPYPYLWSLPSRTLDPDLTLLRGILAGPEAPTWIVVRGKSTLDRLEHHDVRSLVDARYQPVGTICDRTIYLLRGVVRPALDTNGSCGGLMLP